MGAERRRKPCKRSSGSASGLAVAFFLQKKVRKNGIFLQKRQLSARRRVLTVSKTQSLPSFVNKTRGVVLGTTTPTTRLFATGTTTLRRTGTTTTVSVLFAQPTSVGWLCKEIIKIFRITRKCGSSSIRKRRQVITVIRL